MIYAIGLHDRINFYNPSFQAVVVKNRQIPLKKRIKLLTNLKNIFPNTPTKMDLSHELSGIKSEKPLIVADLGCRSAIFKPNTIEYKPLEIVKLYEDAKKEHNIDKILSFYEKKSKLPNITDNQIDDFLHK